MPTDEAMNPLPEIEVFRAGDYGDERGAYTDDDVAAMAAAYDPAYHKAPLVLGHGEDDSLPAIGWIERFRAASGRLFAQVSQVPDWVRQAVRDGGYRNISVEIYGDLDGRGRYIRRVALLGAVPPAVKGMVPVMFRDSQFGTVVVPMTMSDDNQTMETTMGDSNDAKQALNLLQRLVALFSSAEKPQQSQPETMSSEFAEREAALCAREKALADAEAKASIDAKRISAQRFADSVVAEKRLLPSMRDSIAQYAEAMGEDKARAFAATLPTIPAGFTAETAPTEPPSSEASDAEVVSLFGDLIARETARGRKREDVIAEMSKLYGDAKTAN